MTERSTSPYEGGTRKGNKLPGEVPGEGDTGDRVRPAPWRGWAKGGGRALAVLAVFVVGTIPFWVWPLDLAISSRFYSPERGWYHHLMPVWEFLYQFGTIPSLLVTLVALALYAAGWSLARWRRYRKLAGYLILCMAVGPGLLINVCLKSEWGRPRPRAVEQFGGRYAFEPVLTVDPDSPGQSFPCGHCSTGFYLFSVAMLAGWRSRMGLAAAAGAIGFGILIGMARVVQGGHFASDVWWAAGLCLATSVFFYYGLGLERGIWYEGGQTVSRRKMPLRLKVGLALGVTVLVVAVLLATPYRCEEVHRFDWGPDRAFRAVLRLEGDHHVVSAGDELRIEVRGSGHGVPGSAIKSEMFEPPVQETWRGLPEDLIIFRQRRSGWFREVEHENRVILPRDGTGRMEIDVLSGRLWLKGAPPANLQEWRISFRGGQGEVSADPALREALRPGGKLKLHVTGGVLADAPPGGVVP